MGNLHSHLQSTKALQKLGAEDLGSRVSESRDQDFQLERGQVFNGTAKVKGFKASVRMLHIPVVASIFL